jgi:hypothetical protein
MARLHAPRASAPRALITLLLVAGALTLYGGRAFADHEPADKVAGAGTTLVEATPNVPVTLLLERIRTADPTDLILGATAECSIIINDLFVGADVTALLAQVEVWVEIDGVPVPVSNDDVRRPGRVVFCQRIFRRTGTGAITQEEFDQFRHANGFQWIRLNTESGVHEVALRAELITINFNPGPDSIRAVVGKRTLVIEPEKLSTHQDVAIATP